MDLATVDLTNKSDQAKPIQIINPVTFQVTDIVLQVIGREATRVLYFKRQLQEELTERAGKYFRAGKVVEPLSDAERDELEAREAAAAVIGWDGVEFERQTLPYSEEAALDQMRRHPWLRRQVMRAHKDDELFFGSLPSASSTGQAISSTSTNDSKTEALDAQRLSKSPRPQSAPCQSLSPRAGFLSTSGGCGWLTWICTPLAKISRLLPGPKSLRGPACDGDR